MAHCAVSGANGTAGATPRYGKIEGWVSPSNTQIFPYISQCFVLVGYLTEWTWAYCLLPKLACAGRGSFVRCHIVRLICWVFDIRQQNYNLCYSIIYYFLLVMFISKKLDNLWEILIAMPIVLLEKQRGCGTSKLKIEPLVPEVVKKVSTLNGPIQRHKANAFIMSGL